MSNAYQPAVVRSRDSALATNKLIRNTYMLLSATLFFSAIMAAVGMSVNVQIPWFLSLIVALGLLFALGKFQNSAAAIPLVFGFTGFMGFGLGYTLNLYLAAYSNGAEIIVTALGLTAAIFVALSAYALNSKKDFNFMGGFLLAGLIVVVVCALINMFVGSPIMGLIISGAVVMLMAGFILFDTSRMVNGGETNYIMATVGLYLNILNLFTSLLHLLGAFMGED